MKKTRYFIRSHEEGFSIIDDWTGQTVSHQLRNRQPSRSFIEFGRQR